RGPGEPRDPQHPPERRSREGGCRSVARAEAGRPAGDCRHPRDATLRRNAEEAWRGRGRAPPARMALLVRQSVRGPYSRDGIEAGSHEQHFTLITFTRRREGWEGARSYLGKESERAGEQSTPKS